MKRPLLHRRSVVFPLLFLLAASGHSQVCTTILTNGPLANRLNVVFLSEGYTSSQLDQFLVDATNMFIGMLAHQPYIEYSNHFNAFAISVASPQSGSSHPAYGTSRRTYFGSTYDAANDRLISIPASGQAKVSALLTSFLPQCGLSVLLVNDPGHDGGSDGFDKTAIAAVTPVGIEILTHETGHVLAVLGDEYTNAHPGFPNIEEPNTTRETRSNYIKWKAWFETPAPPIPTPPTYAYSDAVGLFQGAHYESAGWYRPELNCLMKSPGVPFCSVCSEALVLSIYERVRPVDGRFPMNASVTVPPGQGCDFSLDLLQPASQALSVQWFVDGAALDGQTNTTLSLPPGLGAVGHWVSAHVQDDTALVRNDPSGLLRQTVAWAVNGGPSNLVQSLSFNLIAYSQAAAANGGNPVVSRSSIAVRNLIQALGQSLPGAAFSSKAELMLINPLPAGVPRFVVRDGAKGASSDTDVSSFFSMTLESSMTNATVPASGRLSGTQYAIEQFGFASVPLDLALEGFATVALPSGAAVLNAVGSGTIADAPAVFQGTVTLSAGSIERQGPP